MVLSGLPLKTEIVSLHLINILLKSFDYTIHRKKWRPANFPSNVIVLSSVYVSEYTYEISGAGSSGNHIGRNYASTNVPL